MRLPGLQARPQGAQRPSLETVRPTDLGLGVVAREADRFAEEVAKTEELQEIEAFNADEEAAQPILRQLVETFEPVFAESAANWDGLEPNFARGMDALLTMNVTRFMAGQQDLSPGVRQAVERGVTDYQRATSQRAIEYQARRRGQMATEEAQARASARQGAAMGAYMQGMAGVRKTLDQDYDGSTGDYAARLLAGHDEWAATTLEGASEADRPAMQRWLDSQRLSLVATGLEVEARAQQGYVAGTVKSTGGQMVNAVLSSPSMYDTVLAQVDTVIAPLPAAARPAARAGLVNDLTVAHIEGLIAAGDHDRALELLNGGTLDDRLDPGSKATLLGSATRASEALSVDDWVDRMALQQRMEDNLTSVVTTGVEVPGADLASVEAMLGPREAAEYALNLQKAREARQATEGFGTMTPDAIAARVESLRPEPGAPDFADQQRRYEMAQSAASAELEARTRDPAAWALAQAPGLSARLDGLNSPDPQARFGAGSEYAVGVLTLQRNAGVPAEQWRLLTKSAASGIVARAGQAENRAEGLSQMASIVEAFAAPPGATNDQRKAARGRQIMVTNELIAAGADAGDLAAGLALGDDPVRMGRYVAATRTGALDALDKKDRDSLQDRVDAELATYMRSYTGASPGAALMGGRRNMAYRLAAQAMAERGLNETDAAREAARVLTEDYVFVGPQGWRMPRGEAERRRAGIVGGGTIGDSNRWRDLAQRGVGRTTAAYMANEGALLYTPTDDGSGLSAARRRERYADAVSRSGRWVTTPDDQGLIWMAPTLSGEWKPVRDRDGHTIVRRWSSLVEGGVDPDRPQGQRRSVARADQPARGIRNNNPGNIEARSDIRWQGQAGSDGRFARFETPEHGLRALARDLYTKRDRGLDTVAEIISVWAPPNENNTAAYIAAVSRAIGVDPNEVLDFDDPRVMTGLMGAIIRHENGEQPYAQSLLQEAARNARPRDRAPRRRARR
ncbi:hypothetical protein [Brevundimonas sp. A19_0]|uniref:hypothetical protein n=1 Tax=Brevundimonas sp. A19_0 TaxID=2821087 RepID=UPI001AD99F81|nr:hypothetical protein [Brevundimonas sp. A19_0]MBO9502511.1 hypothetical protein [Brevundimonas sp. A19_0]